MYRNISTSTTNKALRKRIFYILPYLIVLLLFIVAIFFSIRLFNAIWGKSDSESNPEPPVPLSTENVQNTSPTPADLSTLTYPDWIKQEFIRINEYSRPATALDTVNSIVVHYVGNPGTTAEQNRSYFDQLADTGETSVSSHFIIGIDGTVIQCVPLDEIAYASNHRNSDTVSIECCHPDSSGKFTEKTYNSLIKLVNWLMDIFALEKDSVIRHYDVSGKECPYYYVKNPEEWLDFLDELN